MMSKMMAKSSILPDLEIGPNFIEMRESHKLT